MSDQLETVMIKTENGPVLINKKDFDEKVHQLFEEEKAVPKKKATTKKSK